MSEHAFLISVGDVECADCLQTLARVVLPGTAGVLHAELAESGIHVTVDESVLTEDDLRAALIEGGLIRR